MSDKRKPREWVIKKQYSPIYGSNNLEVNQVAEGERLADGENKVHVIEHLAYLALESEALKLETALEALAKRHDWTPGMGQCICQQHADAEAVLEQFKKYRAGK